jgi:hypothetical protein
MSIVLALLLLVVPESRNRAVPLTRTVVGSGPRLRSAVWAGIAVGQCGWTVIQR